MQCGVTIKPVLSVVCRGLDTTSQVGWSKKKTRQVGECISRGSWVAGLSERGGGVQGKKNRKEKDLITYVC